MIEKHVAATVYVVAEVEGERRVFLHQHPKLKFWLGVGGHIESNETPPEAALREAKEEAGFTSVEMISDGVVEIPDSQVIVLPQPMAILEETIPARGDNPEHIHIDFNFAGWTNTPKEGRTEEPFGWFSKTEIDTLDAPADVKHLARRALEVIAGGAAIV